MATNKLLFLLTQLRNSLKVHPIIPLRQDVGRQLILLYLPVMGSVLLITYLFAQSANQHIENTIRTADLATAHSVAQETNAVLSSTLIAVQQLAAYPAVIHRRSLEMRTLFQNALSVRPDINLTYRLDAQGIMRYHYPEGIESTVGTDFSFRPYFQYALTTHEPFLSTGRISPTTNQPVATAVMPIWTPEGQFDGVIATNINLEFLSETLMRISTAQGDNDGIIIAILDSSGQIVGYPDHQMLLQSGLTFFPLVTKAILENQSGNMIAANPAGDVYLYSYVPIPAIQWGVMVSRPANKAFAVSQNFQQGILIVSLAFLISGLLFAVALFHHIIRPLERLADFSQNPWIETKSDEAGTASLVNLITRADQMGILTRSIQHMQNAIRDRLNELSTLLQTSSAVVSTLDSQAVLERVLEQVELLLDVPMSAIFILDEPSNTLRVRASRHLPEWYSDQVQIDPLDANSVAIRSIRSGEIVQVADTEVDPLYAHNRERARQAGYRSILAIRLPVQYARAAALILFRKTSHVYSEREVALVRSFANHATMAMENAALYANSALHLKEQTQRLESLIQSMHDGIALENAEGRFVYVNRRVGELLGIPHSQLSNQAAQVFILALTARSPIATTLSQHIEQALQESGIRHIECEQATKQGVRHLQLTLFNVTDADEQQLGRGWIVQDVTNRYELDRLKSSLISTASHELRTPLAAIKGYVSTLLADDVEWDSQSQREFLETISQEADRLNNLVADLLDISRIQAGGLKITRNACELKPLILRAAAHAIPQPHARLHLNLPDQLPTLYIDTQRIEAVLRNLIENATKYSPETTPIVVHVMLPGDGFVRITVMDEGIGIPPEHWSQVFESFYRVDSSMTRKTTGAGLGLAIARGFVQAHGGNIWLEQRQPGLSVVFTLPLGHAPND